MSALMADPGDLSCIRMDTPKYITILCYMSGIETYRLSLEFCSCMASLTLVFDTASVILVTHESTGKKTDVSIPELHWSVDYNKRCKQLLPTQLNTLTSTSLTKGTNMAMD